MMTIIDRYLLRQFAQSFLICFLSLTGLYIVFDAFTNLEEFLEAGEKMGGIWSLLTTHYAYQSLLFFDRTAGLRRPPQPVQDVSKHEISERSGSVGVVSSETFAS